jgi:hypothetical protein
MSEKKKIAKDIEKEKLLKKSAEMDEEEKLRNRGSGGEGTRIFV